MPHLISPSEVPRGFISLDFPLKVDEGVIRPTYGILTPDLSDADSEAFAEIIREGWRGLCEPKKGDDFLRRVESGNLFIGSYLNGSPAGILETLAFNLSELNPSSLNGDSEFEKAMERARYICSQIGPYKEITNEGEWVEPQVDANTGLLVDITRSEKPELRNKYVASGILEAGKYVLLEKPDLGTEKLKVQLNSLRYAVTFSPDIARVKEMTLDRWSFDTGVKLEGAR